METIEIFENHKKHVETCRKEDFSITVEQHIDESGNTKYQYTVFKDTSEGKNCFNLEEVPELQLSDEAIFAMIDSAIPHLQKKVTKPTIYTEEFVLVELKSMIQILEADPNIIFKGELFIQKPYSRQRFSEWANKFKDNDEISDTITRIDEILETRVVKGALKKDLSDKMSQFHLKNNYGWKDKTESDVNANLKGDVNHSINVKFIDAGSLNT